MVAAVQKHDLRWLTPSPMWTQKAIAETDAKNGAFDQPAILRFDNDLFMDELISLTAYKPESLDEWIAKPETWREPMPRPAALSKLRVFNPVSSLSKFQNKLAKDKPDNNSAGSELTDTGQNLVNLEQKPFKLFQPAQQRYYLITSSLVCQVPGLPDRYIDAGKQEQVSFVVRRFYHPGENEFTTGNPRENQGVEYAFVADEDGYAWKAIDPTERELLQENEERLPMFNITFDLQEKKRRVYSGLVPVARRENYLMAKGLPADPANPESVDVVYDPRRMLFESEVISPWKALVDKAMFIFSFKDRYTGDEFPDLKKETTGNDPARNRENEIKKMTKAGREQIQTGSWYILLDFANFLENYLNDVWNVVKTGSGRNSLNKQAKKELVDAIQSVTISNASQIATDYSDSTTTDYMEADVKTTLAEALKAIKSNPSTESDLEANQTEFTRGNKNAAVIVNKWPSFLFPFADPDSVNNSNGPAPDLTYDDRFLPVGGTATEAQKVQAKLDALAELVEESLDPTDDPLPEINTPPQVAKNNNAWFVIRCVYERPNCGPFNPPVLSHPTEPFQMAAFFDPDAPARPIRIPMPSDISIAGLRKYQRNTSIMISDMLCGKLKKIRELTFGDLVLSVLPWPFHKDLPNINDTGPCKGNGGGFGMFCSLSIPIVTLCALILLIIIVALFDIFFKWIPYLFFCFPLPGLRGKK